MLLRAASDLVGCYSRSMSEKNDPPKAVRIDSWGFETGMPEPRHTVPMFGIFLILFGLLLAAGQLFKAAQLGASALFLALGIVLLLVWLRDHSDAALYMGIFITALALSDVLSAAGVVHGSGWGTLFLGIGALAVVPIRARAHKSWGWAVIVGGFLCLWGGSQVAAQYLGGPVDRLVGPLLLVLLGVYLVGRAARQSRSS